MLALSTQENEGIFIYFALNSVLCIFTLKISYCLLYKAASIGWVYFTTWSVSAPHRRTASLYFCVLPRFCTQAWLPCSSSWQRVTEKCNLVFSPCLRTSMSIEIWDRVQGHRNLGEKNQNSHRNLPNGTLMQCDWAERGDRWELIGMSRQPVLSRR